MCDLFMEVTRRRNVNGVTSMSANRVPMEQILGADVCEVPADDDKKFGGHRGCSVRALLGAAKSGTAVFTAGDGMVTEPIEFATLLQGILIHSDADGKPLEHGGPLRLWFPPACGLRCAKGNPLAVKDVRSMELTVSSST